MANDYFAHFVLDMCDCRGDVFRHEKSYLFPSPVYYDTDRRSLLLSDSKIRSFGGLPDVTSARSQAKSVFDLTQSLRQAQRFFRSRWRAVNRLFTVSHQRFKLLLFESRSRRHARGNCSSRTAVVQTRISHQHSAHPSINIFQRQVMCVSALLQLSHRGDKFKARPAIYLRQWQRPPKTSSA